MVKIPAVAIYVAMVLMLVGVVFMDIIDDGIPSYSMTAMQNLYVLIFG